MVFVIIHLVYLHQNGSNNPLGLNRNFYKIKFHSYFSLKDLLGFLVLFIILIYLVYLLPYTLGDPENFNMADSILTPIHILPE